MVTHDMKLEVVHESWRPFFEQESLKTYFARLAEKVSQEYRSRRVYPPGAKIFDAFRFCGLDQTRVVIVGQDPYHGSGQANGLCFSVSDGVRVPPSLSNIFKEIQSDVGSQIPSSGNLSRWALQGVLLLNATLTVRAGSPQSHGAIGWQQLTSSILSHLNSTKENLVFMLWGSFAKGLAVNLDGDRHHLLTASHPSPYSASNGFFGCRHFTKANAWLKSHALAPIAW